MLPWPWRPAGVSPCSRVSCGNAQGTLLHDRRSRVATDYYRRLPDGRLLWGGRASAVEWKSSRLAALLARDMARIHPALGALKVTSAWSGLMPIARHRMPIIGQLAAGLWAAACFGGLGMATTPMAGELIGDAIAGGDDRYRRFAPFGTPFAGWSPSAAGGPAIDGRTGRGLPPARHLLVATRDVSGQGHARRGARDGTGTPRRRRAN